MDTYTSVSSLICVRLAIESQCRFVAELERWEGECTVGMGSMLLDYNYIAAERTHHLNKRDSLTVRWHMRCAEGEF